MRTANCTPAYKLKNTKITSSEEPYPTLNVMLSKLSNHACWTKEASCFQGYKQACDLFNFTGAGIS